MERRASRTLICAATLAALCAGSTIALGQTDPLRGRTAAGIAPQIQTVTQTGACAAGADTRADLLTPPDLTPIDNVPAGAMALTKTCDGITIGTFSAEASTTATGAALVLVMFADCVLPVTPNPCTPGQRVFADPGAGSAVGFRTTSGSANGGLETHTMTMVWHNLGRGRWRFFAKVGGINNAFVFFRTFTVQTY